MLRVTRRHGGSAVLLFAGVASPPTVCSATLRDMSLRIAEMVARNRIVDGASPPEDDIVPSPADEADPSSSFEPRPMRQTPLKRAPTPEATAAMEGGVAASAPLFAWGSLLRRLSSSLLSSFGHRAPQNATGARDTSYPSRRAGGAGMPLRRRRAGCVPAVGRRLAFWARDPSRRARGVRFERCTTLRAALGLLSATSLIK